MLDLHDDIFNEIFGYLKDESLYSFVRTSKSLHEKIYKLSDDLIKQRYKLFIKDHNLNNPIKAYNMINNIFGNHINLDVKKFKLLIERSIDNCTELYIILSKTMSNTVNRIKKEIKFYDKLSIMYDFDVAINYLNHIINLCINLDYNELIKDCYKHNNKLMINYLIDKFDNYYILQQSIIYKDITTFKILIKNIKQHFDDLLNLSVQCKNREAMTYLLENFTFNSKTIENAISSLMNTDVEITMLLLKTNNYDSNFVFNRANVVVMKYLIENNEINIDSLKGKIYRAAANHNRGLLDILSKHELFTSIDPIDFLINVFDHKYAELIIEYMVNENNYNNTFSFTIY